MLADDGPRPGQVRRASPERPISGGVLFVAHLVLGDAGVAAGLASDAMRLDAPKGKAPYLSE